jgi:hypothetical protein
MFEEEYFLGQEEIFEEAEKYWSGKEGSLIEISARYRCKGDEKHGCISAKA